MSNQKIPKRIYIPTGEQIANLFDVCCELENVDRTEGFAIILRPWVEHILNSLGTDPCGNIDQLAFIEGQLNEVFPPPKVRPGGLVA